MVQRPRKLIGFSILFFLLSLALILIFVASICLPTQTYDSSNTIAYNATIKKIEKKNADYLISLNEYNNILFVDSLAIIEGSTFNSLSEHTNIRFEIPKDAKDFFERNESTQRAIVSLLSNDSHFITLDSSNTVQKNRRINIIITSAIFSVSFLIVGLILIIKTKKS
ncbi:MAG: hypothetical protein J6B04_02875 [Clostridia bacterium]|nr:hypothetical protein [Clostridia bacterium]